MIDDYKLFIYNPSTRIWFSFGYDESSDDYKVVEMSRHKSETDIRVHIYSVKTGNWKRLGDCSHALEPTTTGVYSNGALHWLAYKSLRSSLPKGIVSLDLKKETYGKVFQLPKDEEGGKNDLTLGVLGEWFCVLCNHGSHADVWAMKDYGVEDSWTKLVSIPCHN
nr:hypothetical protein [Tanacetum cinerariifolium]